MADSRWAIVSTGHREGILTANWLKGSSLKLASQLVTQAVRNNYVKQIPDTHFQTFLTLKCWLRRLWKLHMPWKSCNACTKRSLFTCSHLSRFIFQQDLSSIFFHVLFKMELLRTICLYKDFSSSLWWQNTSNVSCSENIKGITSFSTSFTTLFLWPCYEIPQ